MSSFQAVKQATGNSVTMFGTFHEIGGVSLTQNQKQVCKCQIMDDNGEKHLVRLYGTMPSPAFLGQRQQFTLSTYSGKTQQGQPYNGYSGFWNSNAQVASQDARQAPQNALQSTKSQSEGRNTSIERQCAFKAACNRAKGTDMEPSNIIELAIQGQYFIETGSNINDLPAYPSKTPDLDPEIQEKPVWGDDDSSPDDSEIPF